MLVLFALSQVSAVAPVDPDRVVIDLTVPTPCAEDDVQRLQGEIVVCAKTDRGEGEGPAAPDGAETGAIPRAEIRLSEGTTLAAETESADLGMARSQRMLGRHKIKF
jgi:hypothetical protein